ncbi:MAG: hypothetical protein HS115_20050 [Spirochaetales bacterium]|nr:hypothetical protein [Spirochaetales bacterium]
MVVIRKRLLRLAILSFLIQSTSGCLNMQKLHKGLQSAQTIEIVYANGGMRRGRFDPPERPLEENYVHVKDIAQEILASHFPGARIQTGRLSEIAQTSGRVFYKNADGVFVHGPFAEWVARDSDADVVVLLFVYTYDANPPPGILTEADAHFVLSGSKLGEKTVARLGSRDSRRINKEHSAAFLEKFRANFQRFAQEVVNSGQ